MLKMDTPIQYVKGVGPKISSLLARKSIRSVGDVLHYYPRAYEFHHRVGAITDLEAGTICSVQGMVALYREIPMGKSSRRIHEVVIQDKTGRLALKWFRSPFKGYFSQFKPGKTVSVSGLVKIYRGVREIHHPDVFFDSPDNFEEALVPVYSETEGLNQKMLRKIVHEVIAQTVPQIDESLPEWILSQHKLPGLRESMIKVHSPGDGDPEVWKEFKDPHQRRLIFEEFFWLEISLAQARAGYVAETAQPFKALLKMATQLRKSLPFELTGDQEKTLAEITRDLLKPHPMNRLVQGDVGSGKTIVAFMTAALAIENGFQVAMMAPTEILAEQHYQKAKAQLGPLGVNVVLLSGGMTEKESNFAKKEIRAGTFQMVIGTHALIQGDVDFKNLGLAIIDEQHRFGVKQRAILKQKGMSPHFLIMTATPIPRTLAMTVYGDLDVSIIRELPKGRQPITTKVANEKQRRSLYSFLELELKKGHQVYVVYPLVEETEKMDLKDATHMAGVLADEFKDFKVGLLHGRMNSDEKEDLMRNFKAGKIHVLVSTTVIEVGVDVPNATVMVIEHAERFGLSQLHQLRGRVGRGSQKSYCILVSGYAKGEDARRRLEVMTQTQDGFKIAEEDLAIRGPGEFLGTRQSGLPGFRFANLVRDVEILAEAKATAFELLEKDPDLKDPKNLLIRQAVIEGKRSQLALINVG